MTSPAAAHDQQGHSESLCLYALQALPSGEVPVVEAQIAGCPECAREIRTLRPIVDAFLGWPTDVLRPSTSLWERLAQRIAVEKGETPVMPAASRRREPEWHDAGPGISYKVLATDPERERVTLLVRLAPGTDYPPHRHAGVEELHLLHGELMVDDKKLYPGDYLRSEAGSVDRRVWSETGCTCVLLTSPHDVLL